MKSPCGNVAERDFHVLSTDCVFCLVLVMQSYLFCCSSFQIVETNNKGWVGPGPWKKIKTSQAANSRSKVTCKSLIYRLFARDLHLVSGGRYALHGAILLFLLAL